MSWKGHLSLGFFFIFILTLSLVGAAYYLPFYTMEFIEITIGILVGAYCSLLPDIDIKTSKVFGLTMMVAIISLIFLIAFENYIGIAIIIAFILFVFSLKHRGVMHKNKMAIVIAVIFGLAFMSIPIGLYAFIGYFSHTVFEDSH